MIMVFGAASSVAQVRHFSESDLPSADDVTRLLGGKQSHPYFEHKRKAHDRHKQKKHVVCVGEKVQILTKKAVFLG